MRLERKIEGHAFAIARDEALGGKRQSALRRSSGETLRECR